MHTTCKALLLNDPSYCQCTHSTAVLPNPSTILKPTSLTTENSLDLEDSSLSTIFSTDPPDEIITTRRNKPDSALKDQQSTGRKRAAKLYPLKPAEDCEWANKTNCGTAFGIGVGIDGCGIRLKGSELVPVGKQQSRHHGPDYNTLNNDPANVHRICHRCHNAWHAVNDPHKAEFYEKLYGVKPDEEHLSQAAKELRSGGPADD